MPKTKLNTTVKETKLVWVCTFTNKEYEFNSPELAGLGEPPSSPDTPPGYGAFPMTLKSITIEDLNEDVI